MPDNVEIPLPTGVVSYDKFFQKITKWFVKPGDRVFAGQTIGIFGWNFHDKSASPGIETPLKCTFNGTIFEFLTKEGAVAKVGSKIFVSAVIDSEGFVPDEPSTFYSHIEGTFDFKTFDRMSLKGVKIGRDKFGNFSRVVELFENESGVYVTPGRRLFRFFPENPGQEVLEKYDVEHLLLTDDVAALQAKKNQLDKDIAAREEGLRKTHLESVELAKREAKKTLCEIQSEAEAERLAIKSSTAILTLSGLVTRLNELADQGDILMAADLPILRQLYRAAGDLLQRSQGHEMPADPSLDRSLDTLDQIEMLYDTLAAKIKGIEAKDWPDQVKEMAIQSLMAKVDVKAGALTNEDLEED